MNKSFLTFSLTFLVSLSLLAQAPQSFNYQTVIRDINYEVLADQQLTLRLSIIEDDPSGVVAYQEKHSVTTSVIGLVNLSIGEGNVSSGNFESIDWANHTFFLEVAADFNNDNDFIVLGTSQLRSVPFALYALNSGNGVGPLGEQGIQGETGPQALRVIKGYKEKLVHKDLKPTRRTGEDGLPGIPGPQGTRRTRNTRDTERNWSARPDWFTRSKGTGRRITRLARTTGPQGEQGDPGYQEETGARICGIKARKENRKTDCQVYQVHRDHKANKALRVIKGYKEKLVRGT